MRTRVDLQLTEEAETFALRFACDDCIHFDEKSGCAHGYPLAPRREDLQAEVIVFCKEFENA